MLCRLNSAVFSSKFIIFFFVVLAIVVSSSQACFIRNCPLGGKRSLDSTAVPKRECMRCGSDGSGRCVGPSICCSPQGCHVGTAEARVCQEENRSLTPCYVPGEQCGARGEGRCVADGVCCDTESCALNKRCRQKTQLGDDLNSGENILALIQRLLRVKDYD